MNFLYHGIPEMMHGDALVPLSTMHAKDPELHAKYLEKYKGREAIVERRVPLLDCSWSDVVQLLPLHPGQLFELQHKLGLKDEIPDYRYFKIDASRLDPNKTAVFFKTAPGDEHVTVKWLRDVDFDELQSIPPATIRYYESMIGTNEPVFNYQFVPHILYQGEIDIAGCDVISLTNK